MTKQNKKNQNQEILQFEIDIYRMFHKRCNITASLVEHLKFQEKTTFAEPLWVNRRKSKQKKQNQENIDLENAIYRMLHERRNITASFGEQLKFQEKMTFPEVFWLNTGS